MSVVEAAIATGLIVVAPGPALAISVSSAVDGGRSAGLFAIAGLSTGIAFHAGTAAAGLAVLFASDPRARTALQAAGALFLVVVGARMIVRSKTSGRPQLPRASGSSYLVRGLITNLLNPWILAFYLAMLPVLARDGSGLPFVPAALVAGIHIAQLALWHGMWVVAVSSVTNVYESRARTVRVAAGAALVATGVWFLLR
jgi:threonine/homoserine/homoserine lactone efflux protein